MRATEANAAWRALHVRAGRAMPNTAAVAAGGLALDASRAKGATAALELRATIRFSDEEPDVSTDDHRADQHDPHGDEFRTNDEGGLRRRRS